MAAFSQSIYTRPQETLMRSGLLFPPGIMMRPCNSGGYIKVSSVWVGLCHSKPAVNCPRVSSLEQLLGFSELWVGLFSGVATLKSFMVL